jgi:hypothetical protein
MSILVTHLASDNRLYLTVLTSHPSPSTWTLSVYPFPSGKSKQKNLPQKINRDRPSLYKVAAKQEEGDPEVLWAGESEIEDEEEAGVQAYMRLDQTAAQSLPKLSTWVSK